MDKTKCITFDKEAQDALPDHIKAKMKADREKARNEQKTSEMTCIHCVFCRFNEDILRWFCAAKSATLDIANLHIINSKDKACRIFE